MRSIFSGKDLESPHEAPGMKSYSPWLSLARIWIKSLPSGMGKPGFIDSAGNSLFKIAVLDLICPMVLVVGVLGDAKKTPNKQGAHLLLPEKGKLECIRFSFFHELFYLLLLSSYPANQIPPVREKSHKSLENFLEMDFKSVSHEFLIFSILSM